MNIGKCYATLVDGAYQMRFVAGRPANSIERRKKAAHSGGKNQNINTTPLLPQKWKKSFFFFYHPLCIACYVIQCDTRHGK